jgi:hypothetical protein
MTMKNIIYYLSAPFVLIAVLIYVIALLLFSGKDGLKPSEDSYNEYDRLRALDY